jgi:DNA modification methylase
VSVRVNVRDDYVAFLRAKAVPGVHFEGDYAIVPSWDILSDDIASSADAPHLHEYQRFAVAFAVARRRAALFLECGLGKTSISLAWIERVRDGKPAMISAPLAALHEFEHERDKFFPGVPLRIIDTRDVGAWLADPGGVALVTHHAFIQERDLSVLGAFVLDESSILKSGDGVIAQNLVTACLGMTHKLALSATPAPNNPTEYATHATWLGYMRSDAEFRARFFVRDGREWRVKGHAKAALPKWLARFALWMSDPAAYGMPCSELPDENYALEYHDLPTVEYEDVERDLFGAAGGVMTMSQRSRLRKAVYADGPRLDRIAELCIGSTIVWATRNAHADAIEKHLTASGLRVVQIAGATPDEDRVKALRAFRAGTVDVLVSKPSVIGHGVNLQAAQSMVFAGYDESYESFHQAVRRAHRQGRVGQLSVHVLVTPEEVVVVRTLERKAAQWKVDSARQESEFVAALRGDLAAYHKGEKMTTLDETLEQLADVETGHFRLIHGDCVEQMALMEPDSVDMSIFSPPFASLFTYSSASADMGNCSDSGEVEFGLHFAHFADALLRVMKPGRVVALHLAQLIAFRARHGRKGLRDFRGATIATMEASGFIFYGEFVVPKNPQAVAIRTKSERLQFSQFKRDSLESSPALNDYVLEFRKPGTQAEPVKTDVSNEEWIRWASGVWGDIRETDVLSGYATRGQEDEKHICPLQLTVIERCVRLWTNPGEVVFSPFAGIGSEPYTAIRQRRFGLGIELKAEYFQQAADNCYRAESQTYHQGVLDLGGAA